jgi:hypothetical protein
LLTLYESPFDIKLNMVHLFFSPASVNPNRQMKHSTVLLMMMDFKIPNRVNQET